MTIVEAVKKSVGWGMDEFWKLALDEKEQVSHFHNLIDTDPSMADDSKMRLIETSNGDLRRYRQTGL